MSQNTPYDFEGLRAQPHRSRQTGTKADRHSASRHPPTTSTSTTTHPEADRHKDRQTQYEQAGPPLSPRMVKGFAPKDLLAHAESPATKCTNEDKALSDPPLPAKLHRGPPFT